MVVAFTSAAVVMEESTNCLSPNDTCSDSDESTREVMSSLKKFENTNMGKILKTTLEEYEKSGALNAAYKAAENLMSMDESEIPIKRKKGHNKRKSPEKVVCEPRKRGPKKKSIERGSGEESDFEDKKQKKQNNKINKILKNPNQYIKNGNPFSVNGNTLHTTYIDALWDFWSGVIIKNTAGNEEKHGVLDFSVGQVFNINSIIGATRFCIYDWSYNEFVETFETRINVIKNSIHCMNQKILNVYILGMNINRSLRNAMLMFIRHLLLHIINIRSSYGLTTSFQFVEYEATDYKSDYKQLESLLSTVIGVSVERYIISTD